MNGKEDSSLTVDQRKAALAQARRAIAQKLGVDGPEVTGPLPTMVAGAFVTLHKDGDLRGCIGRIESDEPLADVVRKMAIEAAFGDRRFTPVTKAEWPRIAIEISVISPPVSVAGPEEIEIPRHGVVMVLHGRRGVFLPQVAEERGWDRETTLDHLAMKIGFEPGAWRQGATFQVFEADVFGE